MKHLKKYNEASQDYIDTPSLEEVILDHLFDMASQVTEDWLADEDLEDFETSEQFLKYLDEEVIDDEMSRELGELSITWINENIKYVFEKYKESQGTL